MHYGNNFNTEFGTIAMKRGKNKERREMRDRRRGVTEGIGNGRTAMSDRGQHCANSGCMTSATSRQ